VERGRGHVDHRRLQPVRTLDFDCRDADDVDNALHKMRLLRQVVGDFTAALEAAIARSGLLDDQQASDSAPEPRARPVSG
jgi:hypothetical protein